jgi:DNA mismatch repair protein MutS2
MIQEIARLLEFDKIIDRMKQFAHSPATLHLLEQIAPLPSRPQIELRLAQIEETRALAAAGICLPIDHFADITGIIDRVRPKGSLLGTDELLELIPLLQVSRRIAALLQYRSDIPLLKELAADIHGFPDILGPLEQTIAADGGLLDTASEHLFNLRKSSRNLAAKIRKRLEEIVRERETAIFLQDDFITQRNGRWVIPVRMDSKGMVPGVVHDVSNSGETAFMEPIEIIGMVNELENVSAEEKAEQIRILKEIAGWIREDADALLADFRALVQLDFINAAGKFADLINAGMPQIADEFMITIQNGRHPLLALMQKERGGSAVVPLDLRLGGSSPNRVLLITGPNTGGKTIAIKTAGLLLLMAQSGLPVPAANSSVFPAAGRLLADIGDDQSIEESLSTFSAHIGKISKIVERADQRTVVLLDELGTGTDPLQGGAIACATLADLMSHGALVLATTHLTDIVTFAHKTSGMANAAMEFDRNRLIPCYRLIMGEPGESHAIDIARRCGLPERILQKAQQLAGTMESEFHTLLAELKESRMKNELLLAATMQREKLLAEKENQAEQALHDIARKAAESRLKALADAKNLVNAARAEINRILDEARREKSRKTAAAIAAVEAGLESEIQKIHPEQRLDLAKLRPGATLFIHLLGRNATLLAIDKKHERLRINAGSLEMEVPIGGVSAPREELRSAKTGGRKSLPNQAAAATELNLIGCRVDEAVAQVDRFIDDAILNGSREVRIIHGKGTGALMRSVREQLSRSQQIESFRPGEAFEGGDGVTVVILQG